MAYTVDQSKIGKKVRINKAIYLDSGVLRLKNYKGIVKDFRVKKMNVLLII